MNYNRKMLHDTAFSNGAPYRTPNLACKYKTSTEASIGFRAKIIVSSSYEQKSTPIVNLNTSGLLQIK
jgi:hypothetical protein